MDSRFTDEQYASSYPDGGELHWWPLARNRVIRRVVADAAPTEPKILEVGCGRGLVVDSLRKSGFDCEGVEPGDVVPLSGVRAHVYPGVYAFDLPAASRQRYDTILLLDVIEHLSEPAQLLGQLVASFPALSTVIVTVPARQELWSNYDEYFGHFRRYSIPMLEDVARQHHWTLRHAQYFFHSLYPPALLLAATGTRRATSIAPPRGLTRLLHRIVASVMVLDSLLLPRRLVGTSLIAAFQVDR